MKVWRRTKSRESGQNLLEMALLLPLLLGIAFNAFNYGYFWFAIVNLSSAPRLGAEYASQGGAGMAQVPTAPSNSDVIALVVENLAHSLDTNASTKAYVQSCSTPIGGGTATCSVNRTGYSFPVMPADPENSRFVLRRVAVAYTVKPLVPGALFRVVLPSNLTFYRRVTMRSLYF